MDNYAKQKDFCKDLVIKREEMPLFACFFKYRNKGIVLSLIHEFELNGKVFDLTLDDIAAATLTPKRTIRRHITELLRDGVITSQPNGQGRILRIK